jgi:16S rRNA (cytosine967-C5)-methyltransferase
LASELVMGVLRWRSLLDADIAGASSQRIEKLDSEVLTALRLGIYQLRFLDRIPARAAVHESVEVVKRARKRSAAPLVNAVLRKLTTAGKLAAPDWNAQSISDPHALAAMYSHPTWLVQRWIETYGLDAARQICAYDQQRPPTALRLRDSQTEQHLRDEGVELAPGVLVRSARRVVAGDLTRTHAFREGKIAIQDEASQLVALVVGSGENILDCCAAPGGKTQIMAERNPGALVFAVELHPHRATLLRRLVDSPNVRVISADARTIPLRQSFGAILADVPCSGTGTLARNPDIKWRLRPEDLGDLQTRQLEILRAAVKQLAPGGHLIYSTCSLEREENEDVVQSILAENRWLKLMEARTELKRLQAEGELTEVSLDSMLTGSYLRTIPGLHPCDGFFAAVLHKP